MQPTLSAEQEVYKNSRPTAAIFLKKMLSKCKHISDFSSEVLSD